MLKLFVILMSFSFAVSSMSEDSIKVKFREKKRIDFESLLIQGEKKKADYSVVTGNLGEEDFGLLKIRENFNDLMANDFQEEIQ